MTSSFNRLIAEKALSLGFSDIGFSKSQKLEKEAKQLEIWLNRGYHGKMKYMEDHFEKRVDPTQLVPGAKTIISLSYNYHNPEKPKDQESPKIASYAYGRDYHKVVKKKLKTLYAYIQSIAGNVQGRYFVDSAPVMERDWSAKSGLGWLGKNTLLIKPGIGSYFFLAEIILDLELETTAPINDHCGTCTRCIDACPTNAISDSGYLLDASKCISYLTIELREEIPTEFKDKMEGWIFGCDICQEVCPWNRFARKHSDQELDPHPELLSLSAEDWSELTEYSYNQLLAHTPVNRVKFKGLKRNLGFIRDEH